MAYGFFSTQLHFTPPDGLTCYLCGVGSESGASSETGSAPPTDSTVLTESASFD